MLFTATWVDLEIIMPSELSERKTNIIGSQVKGISKTKDGTQSRKMIAKDWRVGQIGRYFLRLNIFMYKKLMSEDLSLSFMI